jgi:ubiquinone/menaquinone biosynthesis C-methylase UbiE
MTNNNVVYDSIGIGYNTTRCADPYLAERVYELLQPDKDHKYLDIGCGTGNYTIEIAKRGFHFWGIDPSEKMLNEAKAKFPNIEWLNGFAEHLPCQDVYFDGAIATLTIHHWNNIEKSFSEVCRVLKPGSRFVIFHSTPEQMNGYWLNHYFPNLMAQATQKMAPLQAVESALNATGFNVITTEKYFVQADLKDLFLYSCKNKPELCFDEHVRNGISTFALAAYKEEITIGLRKLEADLLNNTFEVIRKKYDNDHGDYLFILAKKPI